MGKLEKKSKQKRKKENIQRGILITVGAVGFLSVALLAPNAIKMFGRNPAKFFKNNIYRSRDKLIEKGLLAYTQKNGKKYLVLTGKGERKLREWGVAGYSLDKPKRWDKKWRILTFDIWEKRREVRDKLRLVLRRMGFYQMQRSVWVYPYDCEDFIQLLKADFRIGKGMVYIIADQVENAKILEKH